MEEKTRNGILSTLGVNPPRKQRMSFRQRSVTYVKTFLRAFTREKRYPTCFKFRFLSSPPIGDLNCDSQQRLRIERLIGKVSCQNGQLSPRFGTGISNQ